MAGRGTEEEEAEPLPPTLGPRLRGQDLTELAPQPLASGLAVPWRWLCGQSGGRHQPARGEAASAPSLALWATARALLSSRPHPRGPPMSVPTQLRISASLWVETWRPWDFISPSLESGCGQGFTAFQAFPGFGALFASLDLSFGWRSSASRWLGHLPEVTQQARVAKINVRASPGL